MGISTEKKESMVVIDCFQSVVFDTLCYGTSTIRIYPQKLRVFFC